MAETRIEMLQRHVEQGQIRSDRQLQLIADLEHAGLHDLEGRAREFLGQMLEFQKEAEAHLATEEAKGALILRVTSPGMTDTVRCCWRCECPEISSAVR